MELRELTKNNRIVVGVSGGPDSVYLLDLLSKTGADLIVAHVNHGIRGKDSDRDEKFVKKLAKEYGYPFACKRVKIKGPGIEEKAREIRYKFLRDTAKKHKAFKIALGSTLDDNIETILLNIVRGCSLKGLSGMRENNNDVIRPLLNTKKTEILKYLKKHKQNFCVDKTNKDPKYTRNFVRLKIVPQLLKINPNLHETIGKNLPSLREIDEHMTKEANVWIKKNIKNGRAQLGQFQKIDPALQKFIIIQIFEGTRNLQKNHVDEILSIIKKGVGKKQKTFQNTRIEILNKNIVFSKPR